MKCDRCNSSIFEDDYDIIRNGKRYCEPCGEELGYITYPHEDMCGCEQCAIKYEREL